MERTRDETEPFKAHNEFEPPEDLVESQADAFERHQF